MSAHKLHLIESKTWQIGILPDAGASIAFGRVSHHGKWLDFFRPTDEVHYDDPSECASYVLIPWSNRVKDGHFRYEGKDYQLQINAKDGTAIHGVAKEYPWTVLSADSTRVVLDFHSANVQNVNFPWKFSSKVEYCLDGDYFTVMTEIKNEDSVAFPAGFGHHPYFMRTLAGDKDTVQLEIPCPEYFVAPNRIPSAAPVPVEPRVDFQLLRELGAELVDDCLTGRTGEQPAQIVYSESRKAFTLHFDRIFQNVVVYIPPGTPFFAVEPVTNANDGFNLYDKKIPGSGVFILPPGKSQSGTFTIRAENR